MGTTNVVCEKGNREGDVRRRDVLKAISAVPSALIPLGTARAAEQKTIEGTAALAAAAYQRRVFDDHEWDTVKVLSDLTIPADGQSGSATQACVPEFIDD